MTAIINAIDLYNNKSSIIRILSKNNWGHFKRYFFIAECRINKNYNDEFKKAFCHFYVMNGPMGLNEKQKQALFNLLILRERNIKIILNKLYNIKGYGNKNKLYLSFCTKLIHTLDNRLPIYDGNIASILKLTPQTHLGSLEKKIINRIEIYNILKSKYKLLLSNTYIIKYLKDIRKELRTKAKLDKFTWQDNLLSNTKLLDSTLWALYSVKKGS